MNKTLIGKEGYLFLQNDASKELEIHCNNLSTVQDTSLTRYTFKNFLLIVFPNKSWILKDYLPNEYIAKYRPSLDIYKNILKENVYDTYNILKYYNDVYYKTDTHINVKGNYIVYIWFINYINKKWNLNIKPKNCILINKKCILNTLPYCIGDLTWKDNLGNQTLEDTIDSFYYCDEVLFYCYYIIKENENIEFLDYNMDNKTSFLNGRKVDWNIISDYIIYKKNDNKNGTALFFYDSFILSVLPLYLSLFKHVYMVKAIYNNNIIDKIKPDYIFEFRVERFLF